MGLWHELVCDKCNTTFEGVSTFKDIRLKDMIASAKTAGWEVDSDKNSVVCWDCNNKVEAVQPNAQDCAWFACLYARDTGCFIQGYLDEPAEGYGGKAECPFHDKPWCVRVVCKYCSRQPTEGVCRFFGVE
jgi:hypothetical protein